MQKKTTVQVSRAVRTQLKVWAAKRDCTMSEAISRLLNETRPLTSKSINGPTDHPDGPVKEPEPKPRPAGEDEDEREQER